VSSLAVICRDCRRIQESDHTCAECNGRALLHWPRDLVLLRRDAIVGLAVAAKPQGAGWIGLMLTVLLMLALAVVGGMIDPDGVGGAMMGLFAGGAIGSTVQYRRLRIKREPQLLKAAPPRRALPERRDVHIGVARRFDRTLASLLSATPCLASRVVARRAADGDEVFHREATTDFWLDGSDGAILIRGVMKIEGKAGEPVAADAPAARAALAIASADWLSLSELSVEEILVEPGARLEIEGKVTEELVADLGYRGSTSRVLRGVLGAPVLVRRVDPT
jgi:hypothetical protein